LASATDQRRALVPAELSGTPIVDSYLLDKQIEALAGEVNEFANELVKRFAPRPERENPPQSSAVGIAL